MMKIPYVTPPQSPAEIERAQKQVASMTQCIEVLSDWGKKHKYRILKTADRQALVKMGVSETLVANAAFYTERIKVPRDGALVEEDVIMVGFTSAAFDSAIYASDAIKRTLADTHAGRCAYCETLINNSSYGDVEHFRPKAGYTSGGVALFRPGYYALAYTPENLFLSCQLCNGAYKQNAFPVIGDRYPDVTIDKEVPVLVNPYLEEPRDLIRFNPLNGRAYPFDLVKAFYAATDGWGPPQVEQELWADPAKIPDQASYSGQSLTHAHVNAAYVKWLQTSLDASLQRGIRTIGILDLNRKALVRARVNHLRQLRMLVWTASTSNTDQAAAKQLGATLIGNDPGRALVAPEYLSLSIDALQSWTKNPTSGSVADYNAVLQAFVPQEAIVVPPPHNDALMYMMLASDWNVSGKRRIIYITDKDKVYGASEQNAGLCFAIEWEADLDNRVEICRGKELVGVTTIGGLLSIAPTALWRTFANREVWAFGNYGPVDASKV